LKRVTGLMLVANPVDGLTYLTQRFSGLPTDAGHWEQNVFGLGEAGAILSDKAEVAASFD
jgi:malate/lactate dehydrogenase